MIKKYQMFVSSTYKDLIEERKETAIALLEADCIPTGMELFPASNNQQWEVIKRVIDDCDYYLLIIGGRYGSLGINNEGKKVSYTEMEYDYAVSAGKPVIAFILKDPDSLPASKTEKNQKRTQQLIRFRKKVENGRIVRYWTNKYDLKAAVVSSIHKFVQDNPSGGWVKYLPTMEAAKKLVSVKALEEREKYFCSNTGVKPCIFVVTNDLTCDADTFYDEIQNNIEKGVVYTYVVPPGEVEEDTRALRKLVFERIDSRKHDLGRFWIVPNKDLFAICPKKFTAVIYDKGRIKDNQGHTNNIFAENLMAFCCAQDNVVKKEEIFYFEMSFKNAKAYKKILLDTIRWEDKKMVEYHPWSKSVLEECISDSKAGRIPTMDLELTAKCSGASCIYCDSKPDVCMSGMENELDFSHLKEATLAAKKRGLKWVYTCGLGEPLEDPKFWDYIQLLKENHIRLSMFSNGVFIRDLATAKKLKECGVNIVLKMDTFDEEKFDKILGRPGTAKKIYAARDYLIEAGYGANQNGLTDLAFSIVPTSYSLEGIPEVISFCKDHGIFASIGELEQAGEVINNNLVPVLGLSESDVQSLKAIADDYCGGSYMRPICPCILTGVHIDNLGNCVVDRESGLNCKWFLLKDPSVVKIGNLKETTIENLHNAGKKYRMEAFATRKEAIHNSCDVSYVFGGCGGNPKDIIRLVEQELIP